MPGGGPQGTLLALLLFLVLVNDLGFEGQVNNAGSLAVGKRNIKILNAIHLKYVDDLTLAEAINLPEKLLSQPVDDRPQPDVFHARTGHFLPNGESKVYSKLIDTLHYANENGMKVNFVVDGNP